MSELTTHHALHEPEPARKLDATGLLQVRCACGYVTAPGTEARVRAAAEGHYAAVMSDRTVWLAGCPYCAVKSTGYSRSGAFLMWFGHWADCVGDGVHPVSPEPPTDDLYEGIRLSNRHVELMSKGTQP